jgi:hypothetical protein
MFKSMVMAIATMGVGAAGTNAALACGGGSCGAGSGNSIPAPPVATASAGAVRSFTYEPGYRLTAPSFGRSTTSTDYGSPSLGVRPAENKPLGRMP